MHHLRAGHFSQATVSAVEHASTVPVLGKAATLLSIAKLCAKLAGDTTTAQEEAPPSALAQGNPKRLFMPSAVSPAKAKTGLSVPLQISQADLDSAVQNLNADLAVIRAQEIVLDTLPK